MTDQEVLRRRLPHAGATLRRLRARARLAGACACEEGLIPATGTRVAEWRFTTAHLARARRMREIERSFDAAPELAALVADMLEEMDALRARLRREGLP